MFPENKSGKCFSTFHHQGIPRRNSIRSVTAWPFMRSENCLIFFFFFFQDDTCRKFFIFLLSYLLVFWLQISSAFAIIFAERHGLSWVQVQASSRCHNQWFDTVSSNLGTSLGFDHNNEKKKCAFAHARLIYSMENYFTGGRCRLAWRVLTLADENYIGEPLKILVKCFKNFVYPWYARKKRQIPNGISKYFSHWSIGQFMNCFITARRKSKIETASLSVKWIPIFLTRSL